MRVLKSMEIQFLRILPKVQKNASQHHPNLCDIPCAMFFCDTPGIVFFHFLSNISHLPMPERFEPFSIKKLERKWKKTKLPLLKKL